MSEAKADYTVYRCSYCDPDAACGFNGTSYDCSRDECHHPLDREEAEEMARRLNAHAGLVAELAALREAKRELVAAAELMLGDWPNVKTRDAMRAALTKHGG